WDPKSRNLPNLAWLRQIWHYILKNHCNSLHILEDYMLLPTTNGHLYPLSSCNKVLHETEHPKKQVVNVLKSLGCPLLINDISLSYKFFISCIAPYDIMVDILNILSNLAEENDLFFRVDQLSDNDRRLLVSFFSQQLRLDSFGQPQLSAMAIETLREMKI